MNAYSHRIAVGQRFGSRIASGDAVFLTGANGISNFPCTVTNGDRRSLSGANSFVLLQVMKDQGWTDSRFFTVDQVKQSGWSIAPGAKQIGLQFLSANGDDGLPLEVPVVKNFHVFNASEISGASVDEAVVRVPVRCLEIAVTQAGFPAGVDGLRVATCGWLSGLQGSRAVSDPSGTMLRVHLAATLLEVQAGLPGGSGVGAELSAQWAQGIGNDPLSFFQAVKDAESLAAVVMGQAHAAATELRVADELARSREVLDAGSGGGMRRSVEASAKVESAFLERVAVLAVPFSDKDRAKALGAVWYAPALSWFVPKGADLAVFKEWAVRSQSLGSVATTQVLIDSFEKEMAGLGLDVSKEIKPDGKWHNVPVVSYKSGKNLSGSYIFSLDGGRDGGAIGTISNKHTGESFTWKHEGTLLTPEQRARARVAAMVRAADAALEVERVQDIAAAHADDIWSLGVPADGHGYVVKKDIPAVGFRQIQGSVLLQFPEFKGENGVSIIRPNDNYLIVPLTNAQGQLRAVQAISADGSVKSFMRGAQKKGAMFVLGAESFDALAADRGLASVSFVEGVSTGASFRAASGLPVVVCFDAGNLETVVAEQSSKLARDVVRVLAVDDDQFHVERAVGFLADKLGINPHAPGEAVDVFSGRSGVRSVGLGDAVADGQWHQVAKGTYCVTLHREDDGCAVRSVVVDVVPNDGSRKMSATFVNRGVEAGRKALSSIAGIDMHARSMLVMPEFESLVGRPTDWNDLVKSEGLDSVRAVLRGVPGLGVGLSQGFVDRGRGGQGVSR